jgi:hypothetical protein
MVIIEWAKQPVVEIRDILSKRRAAQWLALSEDKRCDVEAARPSSPTLMLCSSAIER